MNDKGDAYYKYTYSHRTKTNMYVYEYSVFATNTDKHKHIFASVKRQIYTYVRRAHDIKKMCNRLRIFASNKDKYMRI